MSLIAFILAFTATLIATPGIISSLKGSGRVGKDMNKPDRPEVPESGGYAIIFGCLFGILSIVGFSTYLGLGYDIKLLLAGVSVIAIMALIGIFDDQCNLKKYIKATLPLMASFPLVAVKAGETTMNIPFVGDVNFGLIYMFALIPMGVAGASNVVNMFAGFNGLEAGMGFIITATMGLWSVWLFNSLEAAAISFAMAGALLAFLMFNWHPAKVFIGDIGTLSIGAAIASIAIIGNFETAGMLMLSIYYLDFIIKAFNRLPSHGWWGRYKDGKLYCDGKPVHLAQAVMKLSGGIKETNLVLTFMTAQLTIAALLTIVMAIKLGRI